MAARVTGLVLLLLAALTVLPASGEEVLRWGRITVESPLPESEFPRQEVEGLEGEPVATHPLDPVIERLLAELARAGYPFAEIRPRGFDLRDGSVDGVLEVTPGTAARLEGITLTGAGVTRPSTAERIAGLRPGMPYTGGEDRRLRERLLRSGLFSAVGEPRLLPGSTPEAVRLDVEVTEPPYTRFTGILGVSGRESRVTGLVDLQLTNIAGTAREAVGRWEGRGEGLTRFQLRYREPWLPLVPVGIEGDLQHDVNEGVYSYTRWELGGDASFGGSVRARLGLGGTRAVESEGGGADGLRAEEDFVLAGVAWERRDSALLPTGGFRLAVESRRGTKTLDPGPDSLITRLDRNRWSLEGEYYRKFGARWLGVVRSRFLFLDTPEDSIPRYDLFAVGGAVSLRGYREEQFLTPAAWIVQTEMRLLQGSRGSAVYGFADAALISPAEGAGFRDALDRFLLGWGVGVRQGSRLGVLGVEYGIAKGESPLDGRVHLRLDAVF